MLEGHVWKASSMNPHFQNRHNQRKLDNFCPWKGDETPMILPDSPESAVFNCRRLFKINCLQAPIIITFEKGAHTQCIQKEYTTNNLRFVGVAPSTWKSVVRGVGGWCKRSWQFRLRPGPTF